MRFFAFATLLLGLAACQPLPHPFADNTPPPNSPMLTPPDSAGVFVEPVAGAPAASARDLAASMATALQKSDIPASTDARNHRSFVLQGHATTKDAGAGALVVTVAWDMHAPDGSVKGRSEAQAVLPAAGWARGGDAVASLAQSAAPKLATLIEGNPTAAVPATDNKPLIAVQPATGAPGDGGQALANAMSAALRKADLELVAVEGEKPSYIVAATVAVAPPAAGKQDVKIAWILRSPNGKQIGMVNQENAVDAGSLDQIWGLTAYDAANAAAPGIAQLIEEAKRAAANS